VSGPPSALSSIERALHALCDGATSLDAKKVAIDPTDTSGLIQATIHFPGAVLLDVVLALECQVGLVWTEYSFNARTEAGEFLFRYDNSPHHPELSSFPHHKHVPNEDRPQPSRQPLISLVVDEVLRVAAERSGA
jgi:hypothetical protein